MLLNISKLIDDKVKSLQFEYTYSVDLIPIKDKMLFFNDDFSLIGNIKKYRNNFLLKGFVETELLFDCVHCLQQFSFKLKSDIIFNYIRISDEVLEESFLEKKEFTSYFKGFNINLTDDIRQWLILNIPFYPKCKDNCLGLCQVCGSNLNNNKCNCLIKKNDDYGIFNDIMKKLNFD